MESRRLLPLRALVDRRVLADLLHIAMVSAQDLGNDERARDFETWRDEVRAGKRVSLTVRDWDDNSQRWWRLGNPPNDPLYFPYPSRLWRSASPGSAP